MSEALGSVLFITAIWKDRFLTSMPSASSI